MTVVAPVEPVPVIAPTEPQTLGLRPVLRDASALLLGIACLMAGNGLSSTLLGTRAGIEGFRPGITGIVLAGFYAGFVIGSLVAPSTIARVGHIRVFAGLASLGSASILIHVIDPAPATWFLLRVISGMCISALYVVTETWLNGVATNRTRGTLFAIYMTVVSASLLGGQVLFTVTDPAGFTAFVVASVLLSMAVVPVSLANFSAPVLPDPERMSVREVVAAAPLAPFGAALSGFGASAILGAGVIYAAQAGMDRAATGALIGAALLGGAVLQIPLGRWSDRIDRRLVIAAASVAACGAAVAVAVVGPSHRLTVIALTLVAGGTTFPLYSLCNAHLNDWLEDSKAVAAGARMVLINGVGSIGGPIVGAFAVGQIGPGALFVVMAAAYGSIAVFALARVLIRGQAPEEDRGEFSPIAVGMGPTVSVYDGEIDDLFPPVDGTFEVDGRHVAYRVQGAEEADVVVLLGSPPGRDDPWVDVLPAIAWDGLRAVTLWDIDRPGEPVQTDDVLALLRELELPWASYVAAGSSRSLARTLAAEHPDRTDAIALVRLAAGEQDSTAEHEAIASYPVLLVDTADWDDPEHLADDIAETLRRR
ncbi:MAG: MFS transporter [Aquihabitans sp.]